MIGRHSDDKYIQVLDGIGIRTLVHGRSTLMTQFSLAAGSVLPPHSHPYEQTGYLVSGSITLYIGERGFAMQPGDSWCIPSGETHRAEAHQDSVALEVFSPPREDYMQYLCEDLVIRGDL